MLDTSRLGVPSSDNACCKQVRSKRHKIVRNAAQARHLALLRSGKSSHFCRPQRGKNLEFAGRGTKGKFAAVFKGRFFESAFRPFVVDLEKVGKATIMKSTFYGYL